MRPWKFISSLFAALLLVTGSLLAQSTLPSPREQFGFDVGADYQLINYTQLCAYWEKLDRLSERLTLTRIGMTAEGRPMLMAIVTSPGNQKRLSLFKQISRRLALAEDLSESEARSLASRGKAVVQIDGGLHATEVLGSQQLIELVWQMVSRNDPETRRILDEVILLAIPSNPDGLELVANWYMKEEDPTKRTMRTLPRLYQKYIGHDNNRDFYMITQPETEAISRVMYLEWFPQIVYNHHQTGPAGTVLFCSPFRDPFNYFFDPLVPMGIELVGSAMHTRFVAEGKAGATMRSGASYSTWWSGGLRSTSYFHNMIGILTETIGNPTPIEIPFLPEKQLPRSDLPFPIPPQKWHFRQSIEYAITADRAILDLAARMREHFLMNVYRMARNSIERGNRDHWTVSPKRIQAVEEAIRKDGAKPVGEWFSRGYPVKYYDILHDPALRDPRGYIIPSDQPDFLTATKFVNALIKSGVNVLRATRSFELGSKTYPGGSYVIKCNQAYRPHILALFEPQDHPHDVEYPGGPPVAPYDSAGWTLAFQMGVVFDRVLDGFEGPFEKIDGLAKPPLGQIKVNGKPAGFLIDCRTNDSFLAVNRLLRSGEKVFRFHCPVQISGRTYPPGTFFIPAGESTLSNLKAKVSLFGLLAEGIESVPAGQMTLLKPARIGLWDIYGGSMTSGWTRWLLEQFEFPFEVIYPPVLDAGNLRAKYDVLIFPSGAMPRARQEGEGEFFISRQPKPEDVPEEYRGWLGTVTVEKTLPQLRQFLEEGGTILALGSSTSLGFHLGLPLFDPLIEKLPDGTERRLPREKYYIPGSVLRVKVDNRAPLAFGMGEEADVYFNNSPVFGLHPAATSKEIRAVAWFEGPAPLRSGWAWGQNYLDKTVAVVEAPYGRGKVFLYGPEILFRGQPHGCFKFLFNGIFWAMTEQPAQD